jgi:hypothetical protein
VETSAELVCYRDCQGMGRYLCALLVSYFESEFPMQVFNSLSYPEHTETCIFNVVT